MTLKLIKTYHWIGINMGNSTDISYLVFSFASNMYCCKEKCFKIPSTTVDGIACTKCESCSYCQCRCKTFVKEMEKQKPKQETVTFYNTNHFNTCCPDKCFKFNVSQLRGICRKGVCYKTFCDCMLEHCKNRVSWQRL